MRARLPAHDGRAVPVPRLDHRVLRSDQADALAGFETVVTGIDTTIPLFLDLLNEKDIQSGDYNIHWLENWIKSQEQTAAAE